MKDRIQSCIRENNAGDAGLSFESILKHLTAVGLTHEKIRRGIDDLLDEGNLYTTVDDNTYAVTE